MRITSLGVLVAALTSCDGGPPPEAPRTPEPSAAAPAEWKLDRTVLPIHGPTDPAITVLDARDATPPARFEVKAPEKAPNVVIVLLDDMGFSVPSTFGGPASMPTMDRLAGEGLRYNAFHTTALCSPTRMALKTGRNHHSAETGSIMETATAFPGNRAVLPNEVAPLARILQLNGYSTAAFGKWHETPPWEISVSGPFDRWPTSQGFDKFYGFLGGETNQWAPTVYDGVTPAEIPEDDPTYHFTTDMTDQAVAWVQFQQALTPDKPFFVYYAPGATHAPHHVPQEWADKYDGKFDQGWDALRAETLERQKALGVVPQDTVLAPKPPAIKDWDTLSDDEKRLFTRQAEVFAGFAEQTDHEVGRLVAAIEDMGELDNTLFIYIGGDNGTSAEGGMNGMFNENTYFNGVTEDVPSMLAHLDEWGGPTTYPHMAAGWAVAFDTPFAWTKQIASDFGGTRNGMVVRWPAGFSSKGEVRTQFEHVIDVAPTILAAAGIPEPKQVDGFVQRPMEGKSFVETFDDPATPSQHVTQYFEMFGNRAIYHDGWYARTVHRAPWEPTVRGPLAEDSWELYHVTEDFSLAHDLTAANPEKLAEMQALFLEEAAKYKVLPIDDRGVERLNAAVAGRPDLMGGRKKLVLHEGMTAMGENAFINVKNASVTITAEVDVPAGASGTIVVQGGRFGGWMLYFLDGKPMYTYNYLGLNQTTVAAPSPLPAGKATIVLDFAYDGGGMGKGGTATLTVNGTKVAEARIERTQPNMFSADDAADVGVDFGTPVVEAIGTGKHSEFTGHIEQVTVETR